MNKNRIIKYQMLFIIFAMLLTTLTSCSSLFKKYKYEDAKKVTVDFLNENEKELKTIFDDLITSGTNGTFDFDEKKYYLDDQEDYVLIRVGAQGLMTGGQDWGLIYCHNDLLEGKELKVQSADNNCYVKQKIKDFWYFYYDDYDGHIDPENDIVLNGEQ